jgi:toxin ParE1/3/4
MAQVSLSPRAIRDLKEISNYITRQSTSVQARNVLSKIASTMKTNAMHPLIGRSRNEISEGLRSFSILSYIVLYRPMEDGIRVVGIVHSSRDLSSIDFDDVEL